MDHVDISSYVQEQPSDAERDRNPRRSAMRSTTSSDLRRDSVANPQLVRRQPEVQQRQPVRTNALPATTALKPAVRRSNSITAPNRRMSAVPTSSKLQVPQPSQDWTSSLRSNNTLTPAVSKFSRAPLAHKEISVDKTLQEVKLLRDENGRLHKSLKSVSSTFTSLLEDFGEMKKQFDTMSSKVMKLEGSLGRSSQKSLPASSIDTNKLFGDLKKKFLECPELKQVVVELIEEERERNYVEHNSDDEFLKSPRQSPFYSARYNSPNADLTKDFKLQTPARPMIVRDESFVAMNNGKSSEDDDIVELIEDVAYPLAPQVEYESDDQRSDSPQISLHFDHHAWRKESDDINRTFTITESDEEKENPNVSKSRPTIDSSTPRSTSTRNFHLSNA